MSGTSGGGQPQQPKTGGGASGGQQQGGLNPWLGILTALGGAAGGAYLRNRSQANAVPPELRQLLTQSVNRQAFQNPLFEANTRGTYQMLPTFATGGGAMPGGHLSNQAPEIPKTSGGSDDPDNPLTSWNPLKNPLLSGLLGALARGGIPGTGGQGDLGKALSDLVNLFRRGGDRNFTGGPQSYTGINNHNLPSYDPYGYGYDGLPGFNGSPTDPSGGTGRGPGMQGYYDWLYGNGGNDGGFLPGNGYGGYNDNPYQNLPGYGMDLPNDEGVGGGGDRTGTNWWDE
jgi:hypothetical protein